MLSANQEPNLSQPQFFIMLKLLNKSLRRFCSHLRWPIRRRSKSKVVIKRFGKPNLIAQNDGKHDLNVNASAVVHPNSQLGSPKSEKPIRIATFNAALFSMAPAVPKAEKAVTFDDENGGVLKLRRSLDVNLRANSVNDRPKGILKQSPLHPNSMNSPENVTKQQKFAKSKLRVSINLPDNEISLLRNRQSSFSEYEKEGSSSKVARSRLPLRGSVSFSSYVENGFDRESLRSSRTVLEVLRELNADVLALQDVKAEEANEMKPLSDLAHALGMNYVFAESWAPEYGNAVLSRWPIKRWKVQKIFDDTDFSYPGELGKREKKVVVYFLESYNRNTPNITLMPDSEESKTSLNVLKVTIEVPEAGEVNFYCTHLDHLDENWRMMQINSIIQSNDEPYILAGGLNSLDETDYSQERWTDIVKYYEEMGKPTPKVDVMRYLKSKHYIDAKDFAGECESVVMIAKGQSVQGTCKYGTRVDYLLSSSDSHYKFIPGSYLVHSSKGTSDHHIVKVDVVKVNRNSQENVTKKLRQPRQKVVRITQSSPSKGIWNTHNREQD